MFGAVGARHKLLPGLEIEVNNNALRILALPLALLGLSACTQSVYRYADLDEHAYFYVKNDTGVPYFNTLAYGDSASCSKPQRLYLSKLDDNFRAAPKNNRPYGPARIKAGQPFTFGVRVSDGPGIYCHAVATFTPEYRKTYLAAVSSDGQGQCSLQVQQAIKDGESKKLVRLESAENRAYNYFSRRCSADNGYAAAPEASAEPAATLSAEPQLQGFAPNEVKSTPQNPEAATASDMRLSRAEPIFKPASRNDDRVVPPSYEGSMDDRYKQWQARQQAGQTSDASAFAAPSQSAAANAGGESSASAEAEPKKGFWSRLAFWRSDEPKQQAEAKVGAKAKVSKQELAEAKQRAGELEALARAAEAEAAEMEAEASR